jgi:hypothetical protein
MAELKYRGLEECDRLVLQVRAGILGFVAAIVQMTVSILAVGTKHVNWVVWIFFHALAFLFSFIAMILVFTAFDYYYEFKEYYCPAALKALCLPTAHYSTSMTDPDSIDSVVALFGVMLLFDTIFCVAGSYLMFRNRKLTSEGEASSISKSNVKNRKVPTKNVPSPTPTRSKNPVKTDSNPSTSVY